MFDLAESVQQSPGSDHVAAGDAVETGEQPSLRKAREYRSETRVEMLDFVATWRSQHLRGFSYTSQQTTCADLVDPAAPHIPLAVKLAYTAFMAVLTPVYLRKYGPTNFLYFCDVALLLTLAGVWAQSALLLSVATVGILVAQVFWLCDFFGRLFGLPMTGMTAYMFDADRSRFLRGLSLFHGWLPVLLLYLVCLTGYDPRALPIWTILGTVLVLVCYAFMPPPSTHRGMQPVNINYVYGFSDDRPQSWMSQRAWLCVTLIGFPLVLYLPAHFLLLWWMPAA